LMVARELGAERAESEPRFTKPLANARRGGSPSSGLERPS